MKNKVIQKFFTILLGLMMVSPGWAVNWDGIGFLGDGAGGDKYNNKYKVEKATGIQDIANVQHPTQATADAIYLSFISADFGELRINDTKMSYDQQGAGVWLHLSNFTAKETEVKVMNSGNTEVKWTFHVFYADGSGDVSGGDDDDPTPPSIVWSNFLGDATNTIYSNKYKVEQASCFQNIANVQQGKTAVGLYLGFVDAAFGEFRIGDSKMSYDVEGAGAWLHVSNFTEEITEVKVMNSGNTEVRWTFHVYYADGTPAAPETPIAVTGVSLPETLNLNVGDVQTLTATIAPSNATNKNVTWNVTEGTEYAEVDATGKVTGKAVGSATVKVTTEDGGFTDECTVTVSEAPEIVNPYCGTEVGHELNPSADQNSFILLSIGSDGEGHTIVNIKQDAAKNTQKFDYINVVGIGTTGGDVTEGGATEMGYKFNTPTADEDGNITFTLQWSTVNWTGRWQAVIKVPATATCASAVIPEAPAAEVKTYYGYLKHEEKGVYVGYSITRNADNTLTFNAQIDNEQAIVTPQVLVEGTPLTLTKTDDTYSVSTTATFMQDQQLTNTKFYFVLEGTANVAEMPITYTVGASNDPVTFPTEKVTLDKENLDLGIGDADYTLTARVYPYFATNTTVTWTTSAEGVATVNNGTVHPVAVGEATITATCGNKTATCAVTVLAKVLTEPNALPAAPTVPANQVKAVYSATYSADCGFGDWGGGTAYKQDTYGKKYVNAAGGYFGMVDFNHNCSQMEKLHLDVWAVTDITFRVVPILKNGAGNNYPEQGVQVSITGQQWNSIDIALSEGNLANYTDWSQTYQIKIDNAANTTFWLNNVYFYTTQTKNTCALSASVKNNEGGTASVDNAKVAKGGMATFTAEAACGYSFVGWWNNTTKVSTEATYTPTDIQEDLSLVAEFAFVGPSEAATVKTYDQMISIYGVGTPITGVTMNPYWEDATQKTEISVAGKQMWKYSTINYFGIDFDGNRQDVSAMKYVHLDIWSNASGEIKFYLIWNGGESPVTVQLVGGQWNSINIPLTNWSTENLKTIRQLKFNAKKGEIGDNGVEGATILVQDIFFYAPNEFTLSETESNDENLTNFNNKVCDVTIARTFTAGNLYTLALPFDMDADQVEETFRACTMYALAESYWKVENENMYIRFAPITEFKANTPILFTPATDLDNIVAKEVTINNAACETATDLVTFHGTYSKMALTAPNYILAADQYLYPVVGDEYYINGMRGYFSLGTDVSQAPKMARVILHEEITTDNALVPAAQGATKKVMENGRFVIIRDGKSYNAQGLIIQ